MSFLSPTLPCVKARIQRCEQVVNFKTKMKVIEEMGRFLRETLCSAEPDPEECGHETCLPCTGGEVGNCMRQGVVYAMTCLECKGMEKPELVQYVG